MLQNTLTRVKYHAIQRGGYFSISFAPTDEDILLFLNDLAELLPHELHHKELRSLPLADTPSVSIDGLKQPPAGQYLLSSKPKHFVIDRGLE